MKKEYLGDSVYIDIDETGILRIYTENGFGPDNIIFLESVVCNNLVNYIERFNTITKQN